MIPAAGKQPHSTEIEMGLNQSKSGEADYHFGEAYLRFHDKTATLTLRGAGNPNKLRSTEVERKHDVLPD